MHRIDPVPRRAVYLSAQSRGGAVWQLVGLITRRSKVQILPPQPNIQVYGPETWVTGRTYGECQGCCRVSHAAARCGARSGLSTTNPTGNQLRVEPLQRSGLARRARWYSSWRLARTAPSRPL